jgi:hypothetical protein
MCLLEFVHVFTCTNLIVLSIKESLEIYYLRSLCLCVFGLRPAAICLCRKASAEMHPVDCGLASGLRRSAPRCGSGLRREERPDERRDELSSVLYRLVVNYQGCPSSQLF